MHCQRRKLGLQIVTYPHSLGEIGLLCVPVANESFNTGFEVGPHPRGGLYSVQIPLHTRVPDLRLPCLNLVVRWIGSKLPQALALA